MPNPDRPSRPDRAPRASHGAPARDTRPAGNDRDPRLVRDDRPGRDARPAGNDRPRNDRPGNDRPRSNDRFTGNDRPTGNNRVAGNDRPDNNRFAGNDRPGNNRFAGNDRPGNNRFAGNDRPDNNRFAGNDRPSGPGRGARNDRFTGNDRRDEPRSHRDEPHAPRDEPRPELKICGVNACQAVAARRPDDVRRVYINAAQLQDFGPFLKRCAASRIAYHVVEDAELEKITQSVHHEGVCFIVREKAPLSLRQLLAVEGPRVLVYLDGVQNPHNLGAIVRVCAHFGAVGVLAAGADAAASTSMLRTAEGGGEWVEVLPVPTGPDPLLAARAAGYRLIATASRASRDLHSRPLPARTILMLGSETHGLSPALLRLADDTVRIPGTGHLDSINVACACAVLLSEYWRAHPPA